MRLSRVSASLRLPGTRTLHMGLTPTRDGLRGLKREVSYQGRRRFLLCDGSDRGTSDMTQWLPHLVYHPFLLIRYSLTKYRSVRFPPLLWSRPPYRKASTLNGLRIQLSRNNCGDTSKGSGTRTPTYARGVQNSRKLSSICPFLIRSRGDPYVTLTSFLL